MEEELDGFLALCITVTEKSWALPPRAFARPRRRPGPPTPPTSVPLSGPTATGWCPIILSL